ncbi:MAG: cation transporter [Magnetococcales bacterium]|nr:cation transporter [Magnetococcales bacterium]
MRILHHWLLDSGGRHAIKIVHHIPGRIRLRASATLQPALRGQEGQKLLDALARMEGILEVNLNPLAASVVLTYDARRIPPRTWEDLLHGDDATASGVLHTLSPVSSIP